MSAGRMRPQVSEVLVPAGLVVLGVLFLFGVVVPPTLHDVPINSVVVKSFDFHSYFLPRFILGAQEVAAGRWPLWNPFEFAGIPLLATAQPAALYPFKLLIFGLMPHEPAYWTFLVVHYLLSGFGFIWFAREQKLNRAAIAVGTLVWVFSVGTIASNYHLNRVANFCWIPFCFLFAQRILNGPRLRDFASLSLVVGLQLTAGYPEWALDTAIMVGLMFVLRPLCLRVKFGWRESALVVAAVGLGALVASAQIFPLAEIAHEA